MTGDDFRSNEQSVVLEGEDTLSIVHVAADGTETVLKASLPVLDGSNDLCSTRRTWGGAPGRSPAARRTCARRCR